MVHCGVQRTAEEFSKKPAVSDRPVQGRAVFSSGTDAGVPTSASAAPRVRQPTRVGSIISYVLVSTLFKNLGGGSVGSDSIRETFSDPKVSTYFLESCIGVWKWRPADCSDSIMGRGWDYDAWCGGVDSLRTKAVPDYGADVSPIQESLCSFLELNFPGVQHCKPLVEAPRFVRLTNGQSVAVKQMRVPFGDQAPHCSGVCPGKISGVRWNACG